MQSKAEKLIAIERIVIQGYRLFERFELEPTSGLNIVVGDNEAGKSTLLEAINLVLTGRINGKWAAEDLNPHWFNQQAVAKFFADHEAKKRPLAPEILIELYL